MFSDAASAYGLSHTYTAVDDALELALARAEAETDQNRSGVSPSAVFLKGLTHPEPRLPEDASAVLLRAAGVSHDRKAALARLEARFSNWHVSLWHVSRLCLHVQ
jgi:hypothetical protein